MGVKTYDHAVIIGGKLYPAGYEIPTVETTTVIEPEKPTKKAVTKNDKGTSRKA